MKLIRSVLIKEFFIIKYFQVVSFDAEWREVYIGYVRKDLFTGTIDIGESFFFIFSVMRYRQWSSKHVNNMDHGYGLPRYI